MKIQEIRVLVEPFVLIDDSIRIQVRVYSGNDKVINVQKVMALDYLKSIFDVVWEDIGRELKKGLLESEKDEKPI